MSRDGLIQIRGIAATIQNIPTIQNSRGEPIPGTPVTFAQVSALIQPLAGRELIAAQQIFAEVTHRIQITPFVAGVVAKMQVLAGGVVYDIGAVLPVRAGRELELLAVQRGT